MLRVKANFIAYLLIACFALLQALTPFIHAHTDTNHTAQSTGFHVGSPHEEITIGLTHRTNHAHAPFSGVEHTEISTLPMVPHAEHTISVASGIKEKADLELIIVTSLIVLFVLCLASIPQSVYSHFLALQLTPHQLLKHQLPVSRAPPQF